MMSSSTSSPAALPLRMCLIIATVFWMLQGIVAAAASICVCRLSRR
jgi:hypothetical protein